jgi:ribosomal protein S18 acetylase RimI-like enzyme
MRFELTDAIIDDILFAMESQDDDYSFDTKRCMVSGGNLDEFAGFEDADFEEDSADDEPGRYIDIPEWDSADGFALMEHFTAGVKNPKAQRALSGALNRGKGVFRAFKDALAAFPELEKRWFVYKEDEMKRAIRDWYDGLREEWGLEGVTRPTDARESGDNEALVAEDFIFRDCGEADIEAAVALHQACLDEHCASENLFLHGEIVHTNMQPDWNCPGSEHIAALTPAGDFAGYAVAQPEGRAMHIKILLTSPDYRGLGLGEALLERLLSKIDAKNLGEVTINLPKGADGFASALVKFGFKPLSTRWARENQKNNPQSAN